MLQSNIAAHGQSRARGDPKSPIEFYTIQVMPLADGCVSVGVKATTCEPLPDDDFELVDMDVASTRVASIDEALAVIRGALAFH